MYRVPAFDVQIGFGERNRLSAFGIDGKESNVGFAVGDSVHGLAGGVKDHEFDTDAQTIGQGLGNVDRDAVRRRAGSIAPRQHRIADIDRGAQRSGRRQHLGGKFQVGHGRVVFMK